MTGDLVVEQNPDQKVVLTKYPGETAPTIEFSRKYNGDVWSLRQTLWEDDFFIIAFLKNGVYQREAGLALFDMTPTEKAVQSYQDALYFVPMSSDPISLASGRLWYRGDLGLFSYCDPVSAIRRIPYGTINVDAHKDRHVSDGPDAFVSGDLLDCLARLEVKDAGASIGKRRGMNLIEGANVTLTLSDDPTNEEVDVTIASAAEYSWMHYRRSGRYHTTPLSGAPLTALYPTNQLNAYAFYVPVETTFDRIAIEVTTAVTGSMRLGVYADDGNLYPSSLILDAGTVNTSTTGLKAIVISLTLNPGVYWVVGVSNASPTLGYISADKCFAPLGRSTIYAPPNNGWYVSYTFAPLPDPFPTGGTEGGLSVPIALRKA